MSVEKTPEHSLPPKPTLEAQQALLDEINQENSRQLLETGVLEKVQATHSAKAQNFGRDILAYTAPEAVDDAIERHAQSGIAELESSLNPAEYTVNYQMTSDMTEYYSVTYSNDLNILVGRTQIDDEGRVYVVPEHGFTEDDVAIVKKLADELLEKKMNGELPDLTLNLQHIYKP